MPDSAQPDAARPGSRRQGWPFAHDVGSAAWVDYACIGECEYLVCELAEALERGDDPVEMLGLVCRRGGEIVAAPPRPPPADYDALPFPAWDLFRPVTSLPLLTHRGCPFQCVFCGHNSGFKPRYRTPANVLDEVDEMVSRYAPERIRIEDETFGLHLGRTKAILEGIIARDLQRRVRFSAQTRVDRVDEEFMRLLKTANFEELELGVESGNPEVLLATQKGITLDQVERAVALARANGLRVWSKFILGHPHETRETVRDTMRFIAKTNPDKLSVSIMTPFPGTPIHEMALRGEGGYRLLSGGWEDFDKYSSGVLELETISLGQLKRYQIACYVNLYARNHRFAELGRLVVSHRAVGLEMLRSAVGRTARETLDRVTGRRAPAAPQPAPRPAASPSDAEDLLPTPVLHSAFGRFRAPAGATATWARPTLHRPNSWAAEPGPLSWSPFVEETGKLAYHRRRDLGVTQLEVANVKRVLVSMGAVLVAAALAMPALASAPQRDPVSQNQAVQGPTSCGLLRWEIHLTGDRP